MTNIGVLFSVFSFGMLNKLKNVVESTTGRDLDGDGKIGNKPMAGSNSESRVAGGENGVIFFPDEKLPCRFMGKCTRKQCDFAHQPTGLSRFLDILQSAKQSLDICVFTITANEIADAISAVHKRGVSVRIITDDDQRASLGSDIGMRSWEKIPC